MFSYYGSKSKLVNYYPKPIYNKIIEPFAGSARYSLKYWKNDIVLYDKFELIVDVWKYLRDVTKEEILSLPELKKGDNINDFDLTENQMKLMKFCIVQGSASGQNTPSSQYYLRGIHRQNIKRIIANIDNIRHWDIVCDDYRNIPNEEATWFIDPPYQFGGKYYKESNKNIDFKELSEWCKTRKGQVIVCENTKADWMEFKPLKRIQGARNTNTIEAIWTNIEELTQTKLF